MPFKLNPFTGEFDYYESGVPGSGDGYNIVAAGSQTANTTGSVLFQNSNGITFGMSNSSVVTAAHNGLTQQSTQPVAVSGSNGSFNFSTVTFGASNGASFYTTNGSMVVSYTVPSQSVQPVAASGSNGSFNFSTLSFGALNGLTFYTSNGSMVGSYTVPAPGGGDAIRGIAAGASTATTNTVNFSNSNGVSFGFGAGANSTVMTGSVQTSYRASNDAVGLNTAATSVTWTVNSSGISLNAGAYLTSQSNQAVSGSNGSFAFQTVTFGNSNGASFYTTNGSMVMSYTVPAAGVTPAASGSNGSFTFSTLSFGNLNGLSFYTSNGSLVGSYTDAGGAGAAPVGKFYQNLDMNSGTANITALASSHNSLLMFPLCQMGGMPFDITASTMYLKASISGSTATLSASHNTSIRIGIYTQSNNGSFVLLNSVQSAWGLAAATNNSTYYQGRRFISIHSSQWSSQPVFKAGSNYYVALVIMSSSRAAQSWLWEGQYWGATAAHSGTVGVNSTSNTWMGFRPGQGVYSSNTTGYSSGFPAQIANSQLFQTVSNIGFNPLVIINNEYGTF